MVPNESSGNIEAVERARDILFADNPEQVDREDLATYLAVSTVAMVKAAILAKFMADHGTPGVGDFAHELIHHVDLLVPTAVQVEIALELMEERLQRVSGQNFEGVGDSDA
jgi:hypothetical protein